MSDPEDNVSIDIKVNGQVVPPPVTARPIPTYGTPEWDAMLRDIERAIKAATGQ